jgi:hypothetical protein
MKKNLAFLVVPQASKNCGGNKGTEGKEKNPHQKLKSAHAKMLTLGASPSFGGRCHFAPAQALQFKGLLFKLDTSLGKKLHSCCNSYDLDMTT